MKAANTNSQHKSSANERTNRSLLHPDYSTDNGISVESILALLDANEDWGLEQNAPDSHLFPSEILMPDTNEDTAQSHITSDERTVPIELMMPSLDTEDERLGTMHQLTLRCVDSNEVQTKTSISLILESNACYHFDPDEFSSIKQQSSCFAGDQSPLPEWRSSMFDRDLVSPDFKVKSPNEEPALKRGSFSLKNVRGLTASKARFNAMAA